MPTEEGKLYWLKVLGYNPTVYLGATKKARKGNYTVFVEKPTLRLVFKGGKKLDTLIGIRNSKEVVAYTAALARRKKETVSCGLPPRLQVVEAVEVIGYVKNCRKWACKPKPALPQQQQQG